MCYCPLQIWALKACNQDISKISIASSFKHVQLIEDGRLSGENLKTRKYIYIYLVIARLTTCNKDISKHFIARILQHYSGYVDFMYLQ